MILVSACLAGVECKYNGGHNLVPAVKELVDKGKTILVCPEKLGRLSIPRPPAEIQKGSGEDVLAGRARVCNCLGEDVTAQFLTGAQKVLEVVRRHGISRAILKERSPSCGSLEIYSGGFDGKTRPGKGITAALLEEHGVKVYSEENFPSCCS